MILKNLVSNLKVSIVIPYRDRISSLIDAVCSVNSQTHRNLEVVIIDDSHDSEIPPDKLLKRLVLDPSIPVRVVENPNSGVSSARNLGIELAQGEYIAFLDSDDIFLPTKIASQLIDLVKCEALFGHTNYIRLEGQTGFICDTSSNNGKNILETMIGNCIVATPTVMLKR